MTRSPIKPDLVVTLADAQAIVDRIESGVTVEGITELHGGEISAIYDARLGGHRPSLVIKVYPEQFQWKLGKEVAIYRRLAEIRGLPVPRVIWHDESKELLRLGFVVMTRLDGEPLRQIEASLAGGELADVYAQAGRALRRFHDLRMEAFGYLVAEGVKDAHASNESYMRFQFGKKLREFRDRGGDARRAERMERYVAAKASLLSACTWPVFCHDDVHAGNLIVLRAPDGAWRLTGVVDVENAVAGDPLLDLAKAILFGAGDSRAKREGLLAGYGPIARADWEETIDLYRLYHALETWDWFAQIGAVPGTWVIAEIDRITAPPHPAPR